MRRLLILWALVSALVSGGPRAVAEGTPAEPSPAAMAFVAGFSDDHLSGMLSRIGARSPALMALGQFDGQTLAQVFDAHIDDAVRRHGPAWQRNLALAWTPLMTPEELESLTVGGAQSPHTEKYLGQRGEAGQAMQASSGDLFREILTEVIEGTVATLTEQSGTQ